MIRSRMCYTNKTMIKFVRSLLVVWPLILFVDLTASRIEYYDQEGDDPGRTLPDDFLIGASTAAYQVEGGWNADGKGENICDRVYREKAKAKNAIEAPGDVACDSYHLYKKDVALLKEMGFQVYRFSISWARILPTGEITVVNKAGVDYYHSLIDELLKNGIQPMVTIYHWDLPQRLQDMGGWMNPLIVDFMEDYADLLFRLYGGKVKFWITINEPLSIASGYTFNFSIPSLGLDALGYYTVAYNVLRAHERVYRLYDREYRPSQKGNITITIDATYFTPKTSSPEDVEATKRAWAFTFELFTNPIFSEEGDFPSMVKTIVAENSKLEGRRRSRLPQFTQKEIESLKGSADFFALNHYLALQSTPMDPSPNMTLLSKDRNVHSYPNPNWPLNYGNWTVLPWSMRETLRLIKDKYNNPAVFITENGYSGEPGILDDVERVNYYHDYLLEVIKAREEFGCNVIGYTAWSLLDNVEWDSGYKVCFGIVQVNFTDPRRERTIKSSGYFFKKLLKERAVPKYRIVN